MPTNEWESIYQVRPMRLEKKASWSVSFNTYRVGNLLDLDNTPKQARPPIYPIPRSYDYHSSKATWCVEHNPATQPGGK